MTEGMRRAVCAVYVVRKTEENQQNVCSELRLPQPRTELVTSKSKEHS